LHLESALRTRRVWLARRSDLAGRGAGAPRRSSWGATRGRFPIGGGQWRRRTGRPARGGLPGSGYLFTAQSLLRNGFRVLLWDTDSLANAERRSRLRVRRLVHSDRKEAVLPRANNRRGGRPRAFFEFGG